MANRVERVTLELVDHFTPGAAKAAGSAQFLANRLDGIDTSAVKADRGLTQSGRGVDNFRKKVDQTSPSIDRLSGRLGLLAKGLVALGPAAVPISGAMIPALAGLATEMGAAALAGGVLMASFQGVGDALEAVNKYRLAPTQENLSAAREQMAGLSKEARQAVRALADLRPVLLNIRNAGAAGFFPGFTAGLDDFEAIAPTIERIFNAVGGSAGGLFEGALDELSSDEWEPFLEFVEREAPAALTTLGQTVGNLTKGVAELWMAMDPLSDDFSGGLLQASERFESWAEGVSQTDGYREFIDYVRETGPQVVETVASLADAVLQIGEAAAPLGGPILKGIEVFADTVAKIADSPLGPVIMAAATAMSALSLATSAFNKVSAVSFGSGGRTVGGTARAGITAFTRDLEILAATSGTAGARTTRELDRASAASARLRGNSIKAGTGAAALAGGYAAMESGIIGTNAAMGAAVGMMAGPWGAAAGFTIGTLLDMGAASNDARDAIDGFNKSLDSGNLDEAQRNLATLKASLNDFNTRDEINPLMGLGLLGTGKALVDSGSDLWAKVSGAKADAADAVASADDKLTAAENAAAQAMGYTSAAARESAAALIEMHNATLRALNTELNWEQSLLDAAAAVAENGRVVDANGNALKGHEQAAIDSQRAINGVAAAWNEQARAGEGTAAQLEETKAAIRRMGRESGLGRDQIRELIAALDAVPPKKKTKVEVETADALARLNAFKTLYDSVRSKTVTITSNHEDGPGSLGGIQLVPGPGPKKKNSADGGTVPQTGLPYADRHPYLLADGEEVISNRHGQADRHRGLLKAINAGRLADGGTAGRLADGGTARGDGVSSLGREAEKSAKEIKKEREARAKARIERERNRLEDKVQKAQDRRDAAVQARNDLSTQVGDRFRSDIFAGNSQSGGWVTSQPDDWRDKLNADISQAQQFNGYRATLQKKGLDGAPAEALFTDADLATIQMFAAMSPAELAEYEALFNLRESLAGNAGAGVGNLLHGAEVASSGQALAAANQQLKAFNHRGKRKPKRKRRHPQRHAAGGTVLGDRFPYGDKTLVLAAPGEEIITNRDGQADQFRADRAAGLIPAYANGGTVRPPMQQRRSYASTSARLGMQRAYGHTALAQQGARPIDIHVAGDSSADPERMAAETARRLAFEG